MATAADRVRAFYPADAGSQPGTVEFPDDILARERMPPPNPLLAKHYEQVGAAGGIRAEPPQVAFQIADDMDGTPLHQTLRLINTSGNPVRTHILHPETPYFTVSIGPSGDGKLGTVMPGMAEDLVVKCNFADGLRYYRDNIKVHVQGGETMIIPLHAAPALAETHLPSRIDFGKVAQGLATQRVLPLHSTSNASFDFKVMVIERHPDFTIEPLSGTIPAGGEAAVVFTFAPSKLATARAVIELHIAQLGFQPQTITLVGSSSAHMNRNAALARLYREGAHLPETQPPSMMGNGPRAPAGDAAAEGGYDVTDVTDVAGGEYDPTGAEPPADATTLQSVLISAPPPELVHAIAAQPLGGGSGGGDAVTRAMALERRLRIGDQKVEVKLPEEREPFPEGEKDGLRVPADLSSQIAVNQMLTAQRNKMRISDLRAAIEKQQADAERQQEEIEDQMMANLPVEEQLINAFTSRVHPICHYLQETDVAGSGMVTRAAFMTEGVKKILRVPSASMEDVGALFDRIDTHMLGKLNYSHLERVARRQASGKKANAAEQRMEPAELDQALHGPERSRQLKELIFGREIGAIEDYEKQKEVKSFVAIGQPLITDEVVDATVSARAEHADMTARKERAEVGMRPSSERQIERVLISEDVVAKSAEITPLFDPYVNETWQKREGVLGEFQQGVRIATIRARVDKRVKALQASLKRQGISLSDKARVHALVVSRTKGGSAGAPPPTADPGSKAAASSADDPGAAVGLSYMGIAHFAFPEQPEKGAQPRGEPITVAPIEAFDETRLFALRVPRRYVQMEYQQIPLTPPGGFPPVEASRELRLGAFFEEGRPLPVGVPDPIPSTWGMPPLLVQPHPQPLTEAQMEEAIAAQAAIDRGEDPHAAKVVEKKEEEDDDEKKEKPKRGEYGIPPDAKPPVLPRNMPKVMSRPPQFVEFEPGAQFRAKPLPAGVNDYWRYEPIGSCSMIADLHEPTLCSKWREMKEKWKDDYKLLDAKGQIPKEMSGPVKKDTDKELSEDESDTEIDPSLIQVPTFDLLKSIFDLPTLPDLTGVGFPPPIGPGASAPSSAPAAAEGEAAAPEGAPEAAAAEEGEFSGPEWASARAAAIAMDRGEVYVKPERTLPVDHFSERARAEAALGAEGDKKRYEQRLRLRTRFAKLNEYIDKPRHQLALD